MREAFAQAHQVSKRTGYSYQTNHPVDKRRLQITEKFTDFKVTRFDLLPDVFDKTDLEELMRVINERA